MPARVRPLIYGVSKRDSWETARIAIKMHSERVRRDLKNEVALGFIFGFVINIIGIISG